MTRLVYALAPCPCDCTAPAHHIESSGKDSDSSQLLSFVPVHHKLIVLEGVSPSSVTAPRVDLMRGHLNAASLQSQPKLHRT